MDQKFDFNDFIESTQVYLNSITACAFAILHVAQNFEDKNLEEIGTALKYNIESLKEEFAKYTELYKKADE